MAISNSDGSIILTTKIDTSGVSKAIDALKRKIDSVKDKKAAIQQLTQAIKDQQYVIKQLEIEYSMLVAKGQGNTEQAGELRERIKALKAELEQLSDAATATGVKTAAASTKAAKGLKEFGKRITGIVKSALIFSLLYKVMQSVVKLFKNVLMSDKEFKQDWEELKAAFYTAAYPIVNLIVPAIKYIAQQVRDWAVSIGKVAAALQGMSYSELVDQAKASKEAADNYEDMEKSSKKTADNVKKQLASFDNIQILSSGNDEEQGAGLAGFEGLKEYDTSGEKSILDDLMTAIGGALAAVGLIILFNGQIGWGVGFLVAGAAFWAIGEIWGEDYDPTSATDILNNIMETIGVSLAAIGIILITKGQLAWGIGFVIAGAIAGLFGVSIATLTDESVSQKAKDELSSGMMIVGIVAIVLGILLCMAQQWVWGIGLIAVGVSSIVTPIALNWDGIKEQLQGSFGGWLALGGVIAIVLGILLCFTPMLPLGIGLIVLGAGAVVAPIVANWDSIMEWITGAFNAVMEWLKTYGGLVLGILLLFTGVGAPLGMALIMDAASAMGKDEKPVLWDSILNSIKKTWEDIKAYWNENIANVWTLKFWLDLAKIAGNGLIGGFELAINGIIGMFEKMINWIVEGLNSISFEVPDWVPGIGGKTFGFNIPEVKFDRVSIPRLAQGAVIPPNREFLAVLGDQKRGTNIEAPADLIKQKVMEAMIEMGGNFGGGNTEVVLEIDGREFGRAVVEQGNRENRRIGTRLVIA